MKVQWKALGAAAGLLLGAPAAFAHELACEKSVNDTTLLEADTFPVTLNYKLKVINVHPTSPSEVLEASDPMLEDKGFSGFDTPFTVPFQGSEEKTFEVTVESYEECMRLAAEDGEEDDYIDNVFTVRWDSGTESCDARVQCVPPGEQEGRRMTGGGSIGTGKDRVTHGFQLRCDASDPRQNLEVNWQGNRFHLLDLTSATCTDTALDEGNPAAGFDTFEGEGTGRYNGVEGATISFVFTDAGEPGKDDTAEITVRDENGVIVLQESGTLTFGNHQAHP